MRTLRILLALLSLPAVVAGQPPYVTNQGALSAAGQVTLDVRGMGTGSISLQGTWTGTVNFEVLGQPGVAAQAINCTATNSTSAVTTATGNGLWTCSVAGWQTLQARLSAGATGTVYVFLAATAGGGGGSSGGGGGSNAAAGTTGAAVPSSASYTGFNVSGNLVGASSANPFPVTIISGGGSGGTSLADGGTFTAGTTSDTPIAGLYEAAPTTCTTGKACAVGLTTNRELKFTLTTALPAGTNGIGKLTANSGVVIGDVNLNGVTLSTGRVPVLADINGVSTGHGTAGAALRVELPTDGTGKVTLNGSNGGNVIGDVNVANGSTTVTDAATETAGQSNVALTWSIVGGYDGTTISRVAAKGSTPASNAVGFVTRPMGWTDGTNTAPTMDAAARPGFQKITDGTNTMPTMDTAARAGFVSAAVSTTGGATPAYYISAASNNSTNIKASAGQIYYVTVINTTASLKYIRLYDSGSAPTCTSGTGVVFYSPIPANSTTGAGFVLPIPPGMTFANGMGFCITGGAGVTDNTSTSAGDVVLNYGWK